MARGVGRVVAVEALVRWQHPDFGLLQPATDSHHYRWSRGWLESHSAASFVERGGNESRGWISGFDSVPSQCARVSWLPVCASVNLVSLRLQLRWLERLDKPALHFVVQAAGVRAVLPIT
jgi:hypothetical protein